MDFSGFLNFLAYGGSVMAVSFLVESWAWFQAQSAQFKSAASFAGSAVISLAAYSFLTYAPAAWVSAANPFFYIVSGLFGVYFLGQAFHSITKAPSAPAPKA